MIYLKLFLTFLEIGAVSFGGGYGMISLVREKVLTNGWLTEAEFLNMIAVSESTPGPIAVNMATFVGATQGGIMGSLMATLGVVLPAFIIMLLIASVIRNLLKYAGVQATLEGIRPAVVGLIIATASTMILGSVIGIKTISGGFLLPVPEVIKNVVIFATVVLVSVLYKKFKKKKISPILIILISGVLGLVLFSL
jgi:chromate transporter